ncbi:tail fiber protein [Pectobacterium punjabense]|uniref:tail fiber protein n=1 Tax=Pectobacterium punjabense TaxID=2108399 RepID=UPI0038243F2B
MASLSEQESWIDGIYQLETSDPVVAGPGGISNRQAEQLANRTAYLKKMQETTGENLQKHLAASDPHSQYAPKNSPVLTGTPTAPTTAQTANNTQIATTAFVKSAIAALINGSPAAMDTLQELANALGNDPHFSTTILNAITDVKTDATNKLNAHVSILDAHPQYAPKASPAFTGTPTAPTAASSSNDTQLATTAFVKAAVAALVNGSPAALDTLQELANALGNDPNFSTTVLNALAGKLAKDQNGADIPDKSRFRQNVGLGDVIIRGEFGLGGNATPIPRNADIHEFFNSAPSGCYAAHEGGYSNIPDGDVSYSFFWQPTLNNIYGVLECVGLNSTREYYQNKINGNWMGWVERFNDSCRFINGEVSAATNPFKGIGFYNGDYGNWPSRYGVVLQGYKRSAGSISLMQESVASADSPYRLFGRNVVVNGDGSATYGTPAEFYHTQFKPTATDVGAIPLGFRGDVQGTELPWNSETGLYRSVRSSDSQMIVHFHGTDASCTSLQLLASYGNGGLAYRTARDNFGFEHGWETFYTTTFKPTATEIGAMPASELAGIPLPFPGAVAPKGFLKCNGQAFDKSLYPILASRYPSAVLPDLRGEFVRGWDDGRGADKERALLSAQTDAIHSHKHSITMSHEAGGTKDSAGFPATDGSAPFIVHSEANPDGSVSETNGAGNPLHSFGGSETRPRNIAFNYIVRAA